MTTHAVSSTEVPPVDEAHTIPELARAREAIITALRSGNLQAFRERLAPDMKAFGSDQGVEQIMGVLELTFDSASDHPSHTIVDEIVAALRLGGAFTTTRGSVRGERQFCAPYVYGAFPSDYPPPTDGDGTPRLVISSNVSLLAAPDDAAAILQTLNYDMVYGCEEGRIENGSGKWCRVDTLDGKTGYLPAGAVRDPADYHACFGERRAGWQITVIERGRFPFN